MELDAWRSSPSPSPPPLRKTARTPVLRPLSVGRCHLQSAKDRFGPDGVRAIRDRERGGPSPLTAGGQTPFTWPGQIDDDSKAEASIYRKVPSMQSLRHNLTALSQAYNLYFVAYQGRIFVYALQGGPKNILPQEPNLQLKPPASLEARTVGGFIDRLRPHSINHMITGFLGSEEIVLACYDDGDVVAYYTKPLARLVARGAGTNPGEEAGPPMTAAKHNPFKPRDLNVPKPFLHENVRKTAWGLAIHAKTRIIAVSTNLREVTIFAFAVKGASPSATKESNQPWEPIGDVETRVRLRYRNWRIIIRFGREADNIPNITFLENEKGVAEKVCAVDIKGSVWVADIWKPKQNVQRIKPFDAFAIRSEEYYPQQSRGWGIMAFREEAFMVVNSVEDLIGIQGHRCTINEPTSSAVTKHPIAKIEKSLEDIPDNPCPPQHRQQPLRPQRRGMATPMLMGNVNGLGLNFQAMLNSNEVDITLQAFPVFNGVPQIPNAALTGNPGNPIPLDSESDEEDEEGDGPGAGQGPGEDSDHDSESSAAATAGSQGPGPGPGAPQPFMSTLQPPNDPIMTSTTHPSQQMMPHPQPPPHLQVLPFSPIIPHPHVVPHPHPAPHPHPHPAPHSHMVPHQHMMPHPHSAPHPQLAPQQQFPVPQMLPQGFHPPVLLTDIAHQGTNSWPTGIPNLSQPQASVGASFATLSAQLQGQAGLSALAGQAGQAIQATVDLLNLDEDATEEQMVAATLQSIETMQNEILLPFQNAFGTLGQALDELEQAFGQFENSVNHSNGNGNTPSQGVNVSHSAPPPQGKGNKAANHCRCEKCRRRVTAQALGARKRLEDHERLDMMYYPARGEVELAPWNKRSRVEFARKARAEPNNNVKADGADSRVADGYYILRAYEKDFEMWSLSDVDEEDNDRELSIACSDALTCDFFVKAEVKSFFRGTSRLSMLVHVPELSLVVLGSPTGRVLLATLTRMASTRKDLRGPWKWQHGIRAESVLPRARDEEAHRRVPRPLHGVALAVIPDEVEEQGGLPLPKRYRLMLHYQTHDIMSYEISRDSQSGKLWVV